MTDSPMTALNKQALTDESARESGNILLIVAARMARRELFTPLHYVSGLPQKVVGMRVFREALEQCEEALQREVCRIVDGHNRMAKKLKEAEAKLEAAEKRIAEAYAGWGNCQMTMGVYCHAYEEAKNHIVDLNDQLQAVKKNASAWFKGMENSVRIGAGYEERIAELEARKFKVEMPEPFYPDGDIDAPLAVDELEVIAAIVEAGGKPVAFCKRCDHEIDLTHRPDGSHYCHAPAAGIGVKEE